MLGEWIIHHSDERLAFIGECERDRDVGKRVNEVCGPINLHFVSIGVFQHCVSILTGSTMKLGASESLEEAASAEDSSPKHLRTIRIDS